MLSIFFGTDNKLMPSFHPNSIILSLFLMAELNETIFKRNKLPVDKPSEDNKKHGFDGPYSK